MISNTLLQRNKISVVKVFLIKFLKVFKLLKLQLTFFISILLINF